MASAPPRNFIKVFTRLHILVYRLSKGRIWGKQIGLPVLLLTTTGRKSGLQRTTPLVYHEENGAYYIAASNFGSAPYPAWYYNLEVAPTIKVEVGAKSFTAQTNILEGAERDRMFTLFKSLSNTFVKYEQSANRVIPVVQVKPVE